MKAKHTHRHRIGAEARKSMDDDEFLLRLRKYIEQVEVMIDGEWGECRTLEELIAEHKMPPLYAEVLRRLGVA
jgi:hypothetical protein